MRYHDLRGGVVSTIRPKTLINLGLALIIIGAMAILYLTDSHAAADASSCDPALMLNQPQYPSSDERYTATDFAVLDAQASRCQIITRTPDPHLLGWTADGR